MTSFPIISRAIRQFNDIERIIEIKASSQRLSSLSLCLIYQSRGFLLKRMIFDKFFLFKETLRLRVIFFLFQKRRLDLDDIRHLEDAVKQLVHIDYICLAGRKTSIPSAAIY